MVELFELVPLTAVQMHVFSHANTLGHVSLCQIVFAERYHAYRQYRERGYRQIGRGSLVCLEQSLCRIEERFG